MDTESDLTWRLPLGRWHYVQPRRRKRPARPVPFWAALMLGGPLPVIVALMIVWALLQMRGGWILP